jgi:hypothetical protein
VRGGAGHTGRLCSACIEGHTIQGHYCKPCDGTASPIVKKTLGPTVTCVIVGLLVAWLFRPYFHEREQVIAKAISAKSLQVFRRMNSRYKKQLDRQASKISRGLDKTQSKIQRNIEIQVRCGQGGSQPEHGPMRSNAVSGDN